MRVLFMGTPYFARLVLDQILNDVRFEVVGLFAQPDKPFGRTKELKCPQTKELLLQRGLTIPIFQPESLDTQSIANIQTLAPDVIVVVAYGKILPPQILSLALCLNLHASILPKYRGASPIHEMIINHEELYGVSVMAMQEGLDSGDILGVGALERVDSMDMEALIVLLAQLGGDLLLEVLIRQEHIEPLKQIHADASYCKKIQKTDGVVHFINAKNIYLKSLAYSLWPHIFLASGLKLFGVEIVALSGTYQEGEILAIEGSAVVVGCERGALKIASLQAPSKQKIDARTYLLGQRLKIGDILS
ncbi:methionyl-tRNA formyltransferase [Helicobacter sp. 12S02634-8]|uniref:methionyl-tRNA formyltransferase n=1 Tax=Helicobacter sp. 12S02634-8 TaxID=1476199 RepID=UPI000BA745CE|nr:methionyl-tRNA formyltransferase [Helicobacter sp. 12S02634-8]PAF48587.1 methionyl-tRNA formyltransferase [Helicobacter sp. 12S02634-8]